MSEKKELTSKQKKGCLVGCLAPILLILVIIVFAISSDNETKEAKTDAANSVIDTNLTLDERIEKAVLATSIGSENSKGDDRIVDIDTKTKLATIKLMADESLTTNLTINSLNLKTLELLEQLNKIDELETYNIIWQGYFVDQYGKEIINDFLSVVFSKEEVSKINFENSSSVDIKNIANVYNLHPSVK